MCLGKWPVGCREADLFQFDCKQTKSSQEGEMGVLVCRWTGKGCGQNFLCVILRPSSTLSSM